MFLIRGKAMEAKNIKEFYEFFNEIIDNLVIPNLDIKHSIEKFNILLESVKMYYQLGHPYN